MFWKVWEPLLYSVHISHWQLRQSNKMTESNTVHIRMKAKTELYRTYYQVQTVHKNGMSSPHELAVATLSHFTGYMISYGAVHCHYHCTDTAGTVHYRIRTCMCVGEGWDGGGVQKREFSKPLIISFGAGVPKVCRYVSVVFWMANSLTFTLRWKSRECR